MKGKKGIEIEIDWAQVMKSSVNEKEKEKDAECAPVHAYGRVKGSTKYTKGLAMPDDTPQINTM